MQMPDITKAQYAAIVTALTGIASIFGLSLTEADAASIVAVASIIGPLVVGLAGGDAVIRNGRSRALGNAEAARTMEQMSYKPPKPE